MTITNIGLFTRRFLLLSSQFFSILLLASCSKEEVEVVNPPLPFSEEKYTIEVSGNWMLPNFTVPTNAHFTKFVGMVHSADTFMWKPNSLATLGLERVAEDGYNTTMLNEMRAIITAQKALSVFLFLPPSVTATKQDTVTVNTTYSLISFASMIAPSPDWFIGTSNFNCIKNNKWVDEVSLPLYVLDAGTEDGDMFGYANPATTPQLPVQVLAANNATVLANGNRTLQPIATVKFKRLAK
jgi:Spondin_N